MVRGSVLTLRETSYALFGAWRLAHFDLQGTVYFDRTREGAFRSFWVAAILLPPYAVLVLLHLAEQPAAVDWPALLLIHTFGYVIAWTAFPVAMSWVSRVLDRDQEFFGYLAMYNWAQILTIVPVLAVTAMRVGNMLPESVVELLGLTVDLGILVYGWFIARAGLRIGPFSAIGIVALDVLLSQLIWEITDSLAAGALAS
jgi:hypothetical protein